MKDIVKLHRKSIIDTIVGVVFFGIILVMISAITHGFIRQAGQQKDLLFEIQKRNVTIKALIISCELDHLIKIRVGGEDETEATIRERDNAVN